MIKSVTRLCIFTSVVLLLVSCGPSPEQIATMTAAAWTPTPPPTPTATPIPYDLGVSIVDEAGSPVPGASIVFPESGNTEAVVVDESGRYNWMNLPGPAVTLNVAAQGYLPSGQTATLERGKSEITVTLARDPYGLLPGTACAAGETLLFMEDFQDGQTSLVSHGMPVPPLGPAPDEEGNTVLIHDFTNPLEDFSTYVGMTAEGPVEFGDAVWRMRFMITQETGWGVGWNNAGPNKFGGITTSQSGYAISFNTGRHIVVQRTIWDADGTRVWTIWGPGRQGSDPRTARMALPGDIHIPGRTPGLAGWGSRGGCHR